MFRRVKLYCFSRHPMDNRTFFVLGDGDSTRLPHQFKLRCPVFSHTGEQHSRGSPSERLRNRLEKVGNGRPQAVYRRVSAEKNLPCSADSCMITIRSKIGMPRPYPFPMIGDLKRKCALFVQPFHHPLKETRGNMLYKQYRNRKILRQI